MYTITTLTVDHHSQAVNNYLRSFGFNTVLGVGSYGRVFGKNGDCRVIKTGLVSENVAYLSYLAHLHETDGSNPYLPWIRTLVFFTNGNAIHDRFAVMMERLTPRDRSEYTAQYDRRITEMLETGEYDASTTVGQALDLITRSWTVARQTDPEVVFDFGHNNTMLRGDQYVFTDPIA